MAYSAKVGSFNLDNTKLATETQAIAGVGFQPKIVMFWWGGSTGVVDTVAGGTVRTGFGAAISNASRFAVSLISVDAAAASDTFSIQTPNSCINIYASGAAVEAEIDFVSMDAGGFTLVYDNPTDNNYRISYLALGGADLTNVYIGNKAKPGVVGNFDTTDVPFQPEAVLFAGGFHVAAEGSAAAYLPIGMATGAGNQGAICVYSQDNQLASNTVGYGYNGECSSITNAFGGVSRMAFVDFLPDGFTLNNLEGVALYVFHYIALKGGQYKVHELLTRTDGNDIVENDVGFQPVAVLFGSANRALSAQDTVTDHNRMSIGACTGAAERACMAISDEDNLADTETAFANYDSAVYAQVVDDAIVGLMDIKSIDANGFTCVMDNPDPSECWVTYLAFGNEPATGGDSVVYYRRAGLGVGIRGASI